VIEALIGRPGSGKSYELTRRVLEAADRDRLVFTNYAVAHPNVFMFSPDQLMDLPPGLIVIDEAHLWFPARMSLKLPMSWLAGMSQTRKKGWDMLLAAQHESRLDRAVRDVCSWMWLCSAWFSHDDHPLLFAAASWEPEFFRRPDRRFTRQFHWFNHRVANAYNTHESLVQADHTKQAGDPYAKRSGSMLDGVV
jgi:hypothetical protein